VKRALAMVLCMQLVMAAFGAALLPRGADALDPRRSCLQVPGLFAHGVTGGRDAVLMVHGFAGRPSAWTQPIDASLRASNRAHGFTIVEQVRRLGDVDVWLIDYHAASTLWVTDRAVGGVIAAAIDCLAEAYDRPIGVMAHSMGGLAVRQVASQDDRASRIAAVVTFGTPHTGSDDAAMYAALLGLTQEPSWLDLVAPAHVQILRACGLLTTLDASACGPLLRIAFAFDSEAGRALRTGSAKLAELPAWPAHDASTSDAAPDSFPTLSLAGELEIAYQASFGLFYQDIARSRFGDAIVTSASATALGSETDVGLCRHNYRNDLGVLGAVRGLLSERVNDERALRHVVVSPCAHWRLMRGLEPTTRAIQFLHEHLRGAGSGERGPLDFGENAPGPRSTAGTVAGGIEPVLLVLDVSGSMVENDGTGTVRLDGAKSAIADMLFELPPGTPTGVRIYPAADGTSCSGGRTLQPVTPLDASRTTALIDGLSASGNTPTGPALELAVEELRAAGFDRGQIVLVSDGESNCGPPPCDVAQRIVADGFDVAVNTLGFQTSPAGREELTCIASATGGRHVDAEDSAQLTAELVALTGAALELTVSHDPTVPSGLPTQIEVMVNNTSGKLAEDVQLTLAFRDAGAGTVLPAVLPPRFRLGNIPAGEQVTRQWQVVAGSMGDQGEAIGRVSAWGRSSPVVTADVRFEVSSALATVAEAGSLLRAVAEAGGRVAIMGDSYSSGEGAGDYYPETDTRRNRCHRSSRTYGVSLFGEDNVDLLACSGAVSRDFFAPQADRLGQPPQLSALRMLDEAPELVLLTIGGNDIGFSGIVKRCLLPGDCTSDGEFVQRTLRDIAQLGPQLEKTYRHTASAIRNQGTVLVLAYPLVLPYRQAASCTGFNANEVAFANHLARELNAVIARSVARVHSEGYNVRFVPQAAHAMLPSNTACHPEPYVVSVDLLIGSGAVLIDEFTGKAPVGLSIAGVGVVYVSTALHQQLLHPNTQGYRSTTQALVRWSRAIEEHLAEEGERPDPPILEPLPVSVSPPTAIDLRVEQPAEVRSDVRQGDAVRLQGGGFGPGSPVTVVLQSWPVTLASLSAEEDGSFDATVTIPTDAAVGAHWVVATGFDPEGEWVEVGAAVRVSMPRPAWLLPALLALAAATLLTGVGSLALWRGRSPRGTPDASGPA
jgi:lysophospholipase L1-like esterase